MNNCYNYILKIFNKFEFKIENRMINKNFLID